MLNLRLKRYVLFCAVFLPVLASAADIEPYICRNGGFPSEQRTLQLARFSGSREKKLYFYSDDKSCPKNEARCMKKTYLIPGDELLINKVAGEWACAWFHGKKHETVGWVKTNDLEFLPVDSSPDVGRWIGTWKFYRDGGVIIVSQRGEVLHVEGSTVWQGGMSTSGFPIVHTGEIEGEMKPDHGRAHLAIGSGKYDCVADFTLVEKYLVVTDNGNCGGVNVRFDGVYTRIQ